MLLKIIWLYHGTSSQIVFVRFLGELKTTKRNLEISFFVGSIPATGRIKVSPSQPSVTMSAANSLQFNQLIGGGISPSVISSHQNGAGSTGNGSRTSTVFTSAGHTSASGLPPAAAASASNSHNQHSPAHNLMIGDYVQGNMGNVLGNSFNRHQ